MNNSADHSSLWTPCPAGLLVGRARHARRVALAMLAMKTAAMFLVVAGGTLGTWWGYVQYGVREYQFNGLTCADVRKLLPELQAGQLNPRLEGMLRKHVARCSNCQPLGKELPAIKVAWTDHLMYRSPRSRNTSLPRACGCCPSSHGNQHVSKMAAN